MRDNTPIYDIKPYLSYVDSHPEASNGFAGEHKDEHLKVKDPEGLLKKLPADKQEAILEVLKQDPRPHYQDDPSRAYGISFAEVNIKFHVSGTTLTVNEVK